MSGILGQLETAAATWKTLYKPAAGVKASVDVSAYNRAASAITIDIALTQNASSDPDVTATAGVRLKTLELASTGDADNKDQAVFKGITLDGDNDDQIVVRASAVDVDWICNGVTE